MRPQDLKNKVPAPPPALTVKPQPSAPQSSPPPIPPGFTVPALVTFTPRADGTFILKPRLPDPFDLEAWLPVKQAARLLQVDRHRIYAWCDEGPLVCYRPAPRRLVISLASLQRLRRVAFSDPDFWHKPSAQAKVRAAVLQDLNRIAADTRQSLESWCQVPPTASGRGPASLDSQGP